MLNNLPPLSGAILISNPRTTEMPSALQNVSALGGLYFAKNNPIALTNGVALTEAQDNPNNRRTVNLIARYTVKNFAKIKGSSLEEKTRKVAARWFTERKKPASQRSVSRTAMYGKAGTRGAAFKQKKGSPSRLKGQSDTRKLAYREARVAAAEALASLYNSPNPAGYVSRVLGSKGAVYRSKSKKKPALFFGGRVKSYATNVKNIRGWNYNRTQRRAAGKYGHAKGHASYRSANPFATKYPQAVKRAKTTVSQARFKGVKRAQEQAWEMKPKKSKFTATSSKKGKKGAKVAAAATTGRKLSKKQLKEIREIKLAQELGRIGAITNPQVRTFREYLMDYALPVTVSGAVAGSVHAAAHHFGVTDKIEEYALKIPYVGEYVAKVPFTIQGLAVGGALALAARSSESTARTLRWLRVRPLSSAAVSTSTTSSASTWRLVRRLLLLMRLLDTNTRGYAADMGGLGFSEGSAHAGSAPYGDGFAYQTAPLTADLSGVDFGQARLNDAFYSGADFSEQEGQAILNGRHDFMGSFGAPPVRMGGAPAGASHLAGRAGHRWGWLVKMVGWSQAARIAAMPPKDRLEVIRRIRAAALSAAQEAELLDQARQLAHEADMDSQEPALVSGNSASAAAGAAGPTGLGGLVLDLGSDDFGATLFAQS